MRLKGALRVMLNQVIKLRFHIDRLDLRQRSILLSTVVVVMLLLWYILFYMGQQQKITELKKTIQTLTIETAELIQKRAAIENLLQDDTIKKLLARHEHLTKQIDVLETMAKRYEQRFIGPQELGKLLHSLLKQTTGVRVEHFSITKKMDALPEEDAILKANATDSKTKETAASQLPPKTTGAPNRQSLKTASAASSILPANATAQKQLSGRVLYTLTLKGNYFSILNFLKRLEQLKWQLYWDRLQYQVDNYPEATVTVEFYTLRLHPVAGGAP